MNPTTITYNSYDLNSTSVMTEVLDESGAPDMDVFISNLARSPGGINTDNIFRTKPIHLEGTIIGSSLSDLDSKIDAFKAALSATNRNLDIGYASGTRRYVCVPILKPDSVSRPVRGAAWAKFSIDFVATEYGKDTSATTLINNVANTTASYAPSLTIGGTAPQQYLTITITVTAATGLSSKTISVTTAAGLALSVRRTWAVGEVLTIDETALLGTGGQPVKVGSTPVDFDGYFPTLAPSASGQVLTFANNFTTRTLTYNISQIKRYL